MRIAPTCAGTVLAALLVTAAGAPAASAPKSLEIARTFLVFCAEATRETLLFDLYEVALYLPERSQDLAYIHDPATAKAFRVQVLFDGPLPDELPEDWRHELLPVLAPAEMAKLQQTFRSLQSGDVIVASYAPDVGSAISLNERELLSEPEAKVIDALVELWLGPEPVSEDIKRTLLGS